MADRGCGGFRQQGRNQAARCCEWSGLNGEEFAPDKSAPAVTNYPAELLMTGVGGTSRRNGLGAIASVKNDCNFPQRRQPKRIHKGVTAARITVRPAQRTNQNRREVQALRLRKNPEENRFGLTDSFRKGPPHRTHRNSTNLFRSRRRCIVDTLDDHA